MASPKRPTYRSMLLIALIGAILALSGCSDNINEDESGGGDIDATDTQNDPSGDADSAGQSDAANEDDAASEADATDQTDGADPADPSYPDYVEESLAELYAPSRVDFVDIAVSSGPSSRPYNGTPQLIQVQNIGQAPLRVSDISIDGSERFDFSIAHPTQEEIDEGQFPSSENDDQIWPEELAPGEQFGLRVWFAPTDDQAAYAELVLESDDPRHPTHTIVLTGNAKTPCFNVLLNDRITFGRTSIGEVDQKIVTIENCSYTTPLKIDDIELIDDGDGVFELVDDSLPGDLPDEPLVLDSRHRANFAVTFSPTRPAAYQGSVRISSDDPERPEVDLPIRGSATNASCPTAVATAKIEGSDDAGQTDLTVEPRSLIEFNGTQSSASNGQSLRYEWTVLKAPHDTDEVIEGADSPTPTLNVDVVGEYQVELRVYDEEDTVRCGEPAIVTILSRPLSDVYIQLTWKSPAQINSGPQRKGDLDLHYWHPNATADDDSWHCFWNNSEPTDWRTDIPDANPILEGESPARGTPESISHSHLESGQYTVGVQTFTEHGYGPNYASVRILIHGVEVFALENKVVRMQYFWEVAQIDGETLRVIELDEMYEPGEYPLFDH